MFELQGGIKTQTAFLAELTIILILKYQSYYFDSVCEQKVL